MGDNKTDYPPPPPLTKLLRQVSTEAREGRISSDQKSQIKSYLLSGDNANLTDVMSALSTDDAPPASAAGLSSASASASGDSLDAKHRAANDSDTAAPPPAPLPITTLLRQLSAANRAGTISPELKSIIKRLILSGQSESAQQQIGRLTAAPAPVATAAPVKQQPRILVLTKGGGFRAQEFVLAAPSNDTTSTSSDVLRHIFQFTDGATFFAVAVVNRLWRRVASTTPKIEARIQSLFQKTLSNRGNFYLADRFTFDDWSRAWCDLSLTANVMRLRADRGSGNTGARFREPCAVLRLTDRFPTLLTSYVYSYGVYGAYRNRIVTTFVESNVVSVYQIVNWAPPVLVQYIPIALTLRQMSSKLPNVYLAIDYASQLIAVAASERTVSVYPLADEKYLRPKKKKKSAAAIAAAAAAAAAAAPAPIATSGGSAAAADADVKAAADEADDAEVDDSPPVPICEVAVFDGTVVETLQLITIEPAASKDAAGRVWLVLGLSSGEIVVFNAYSGKKILGLFGPPPFDADARQAMAAADAEAARVKAMDDVASSKKADDPNDDDNGDADADAGAGTAADDKSDEPARELARYERNWRAAYGREYAVLFDFGESRSVIKQFETYQSTTATAKAINSQAEVAPFKPSHFVARAVNLRGTEEQLRNKTESGTTGRQATYWRSAAFHSQWKTIDPNKTALATTVTVSCEIVELVSGKCSKPFIPFDAMAVQRVWIYQCAASCIVNERASKSAPRAAGAGVSAAAAEALKQVAVVLTHHRGPTASSLFVTELSGKSVCLLNAASNGMSCEVNGSDGLVSAACGSSLKAIDLHKRPFLHPSERGPTFHHAGVTGIDGFGLPSAVTQTVTIQGWHMDRYRYVTQIEAGRTVNDGNRVSVHSALDSAGQSRFRIDGDPQLGKWGPIRSFAAHARTLLVNYANGTSRVFNYAARSRVVDTKSPFTRGDVVVTAGPTSLGTPAIVGIVTNVEGDRMCITVQAERLTLPAVKDRKMWVPALVCGEPDSVVKWKPGPNERAFKAGDRVTVRGGDGVVHNTIGPLIFIKEWKYYHAAPGTSRSIMVPVVELSAAMSKAGLAAAAEQARLTRPYNPKGTSKR